MLLHIPAVLDDSEVGEFRRLLGAADWCDGRATAGHQSAKVKNNWQLAERDPLAITLSDRVLAALERHPLFMAAALPVKVFPPLFSRYLPGQGFGIHVDNAIRAVAGTPHRVRTDLSATLFLSDPETYQGGELEIDDRFGSRRVKLPAGHLVLYPSSSLHQVRPLVSGERLVSFFWLQSLVRDDGDRSLLFDLDGAIQHLSAEQPDHPALITFTGIYHNLLRRWADV